jgi:inhibitor of KinA
MEKVYPTYQPLGDSAVRVEFGATIDVEVSERVLKFCAALDQEPVDGVAEFAPAYCTAVVYYRPARIAYDALCLALDEAIARADTLPAPAPRLVEIPVHYGGEEGPDLEFVGRAHGLTADQVIRLHTQADYRVYMLGFLPGFPFLGGLPEVLATPRRETPRIRVPAGSVGIGGAQTGVYPVESPGGWHLIGRTALTLYDPAHEPRALLAPGDRVTFVAI